MGAGSFVVVVPAKSLEPCLNGMTRATHDLELQQHFAGVDWGGKPFDMHFLPGGGLAIDTVELGHCASVAVKDSSMAVFNGCRHLAPILYLFCMSYAIFETLVHVLCDMLSLYVSGIRWVACALRSVVWSIIRPS